MIRVVIVDDHALVRTGVASLLTAAGDITVVGECEDGSQVVTTVQACCPDVVLMDMQMPVMSGLSATRALLQCRPLCRVLMLTGMVSPRSLSAAADAGANGYLLKGDDPQLLVGAVRCVAAGGTAWPTDHAGRGTPRIGG